MRSVGELSNNDCGTSLRELNERSMWYKFGKFQTSSGTLCIPLDFPLLSKVKNKKKRVGVFGIAYSRARDGISLSASGSEPKLLLSISTSSRFLRSPSDCGSSVKELYDSFL